MARRPDGSFTTQGDANRTPDVTSVQPDQVIGGVVAHVDGLGFWVVYRRNPLTLASLAMLGVFLWAVLPLLFEPDDEVEHPVGPWPGDPRRRAP
jgi:hypothetical protein